MKNNPIIFDGAFGTYYASLRPERNGEPELAVINDRETVLKIAREYVEAGATALKTDTFGLNTFQFDSDTVDKCTKAAWEIASEAAGDSAEVFADIGPCPAENPDEEYVSAVKRFAALGAKNFLFETLNDTEHHIKAFEYIRKNIAGAVIIASFAVTQDGYASGGSLCTSLFDRALCAGADFVGLNCVCGPAHMRTLVSRIDTSKYPLSVMPNAGYPSVVSGRTVYVDNPVYFADKVADMYMLGARIVGGCCGTTPEHIRKLVERIKSLPPEKEQKSSNVSGFPVRHGVAPVPRRWFGAEKPAIAVELGALTDTKTERLLDSAAYIRDCGADYITIPDSPLAKAKANSFMTASLVQRTTGMPVIPHLGCRDRNQIAIKGDLISGNVDGIRYVVAVTGDPLRKCDRGGIKNVFGFNSYDLIRYIASLNEDIFSETPYSVIAALNINAGNFDAELLRAEKKIKCGATAFFSQPVFSPESAKNYLRAAAELSVPVAAGIMPVAGYKNALFLNNEVSGISIPDDVLDKLKNCSPEETAEVSLGYAKTLIDSVFAGGGGFYIMTPLGKAELSGALVKYIRERISGNDNNR